MRPFLTPSTHAQPLKAQSFADPTIFVHATTPGVPVSTDALSAINLTQPPTALPSVVDLSSLSDPLYPFPTDVTTCVKVSTFASLLTGFSPELRDFLILGFSTGFRIGFMGSSSLGRDKNNLSASRFSSDVSAAILKELQRGHTVGPFSALPFASFHCSPLGAVPKKDNTVRIILDLSSPSGESINDGIPHEFFTVKYSSFDEAASLVRDMGKGSFMAKIDIKHAFRLCPVHPDDWPLLGYKWLGKYFFDIRLPFGSRSSPFIFNAFADALTWILVTKFGITSLIHYLDDFFVCAVTREECQRKVNIILWVFKLLGVPVAEDKLEGPTRRLVFLGIEIDSVAMTVQLPIDKVQLLHCETQRWMNRRKCTKVELLSLIGSLSFACKVIKPGRIFLRRLIDLSTRVLKLHHHLDISSSVRSDFLMWLNLLAHWNGVSLIQNMPESSEEMMLFTDASFKGLGAYFDGKWFSSPWVSDVSSYHIGVLELFAVYVAIVSWDDSLRNRHILIFSDNEAIVNVWKTGSSKDERIMKLVRLMFFHCVQFNISIVLKHVSGSHNLYADLLSRLQVSRFLVRCPNASVRPSHIPSSVWSFFNEDLQSA